MDRRNATDDPGKIVDLPRVTGHPEDAERAPKRGIYADQDGTRRVVSAGDVVPDGWHLVSDDPIVDRGERTELARDVLNSPRPAQSGGDRSRRPKPTQQPAPTPATAEADEALLASLDSDEDRAAVADLIANHDADDVRGWAVAAGADPEASSTTHAVAVLGAWRAQQAELDAAAAKRDADAKDKTTPAKKAGGK